MDKRSGEESMKVDFSKIIPKYPEVFTCTHCGRTVKQSQSDTQRKGWPVCHQMTMKELLLDNGGNGK